MSITTTITRLFAVTSLALAVSFFAASISFAQGAAARLAKDCAPDLVKYCAGITPGGGRNVACLISYSDRISSRCRLTAYLAGKGLADNMIRLERLAWKCSADIQSLCYNVSVGGGRIYDCIKKNKARLLPDCRRSLPEFEAKYMAK